MGTRTRSKQVGSGNNKLSSLNGHHDRAEETKEDNDEEKKKKK